jgi:hypothetical protein
MEDVGVEGLVEGCGFEPTGPWLDDTMQTLDELGAGNCPRGGP